MDYKITTKNDDVCNTMDHTSLQYTLRRNCNEVCKSDQVWSNTPPPCPPVWYNTSHISYDCISGYKTHGALQGFWCYKGKYLLGKRGMVISNMYYSSSLRISYNCVSGHKKHGTCTTSLVLQEEISSGQKRYRKVSIWTARLHQTDWYWRHEGCTTRKGT